MRDVIWLQNICRKNNTEFTDEQANQMESYVSLLLQLNHHINLISRKDVENVWERHILHSISPLFTINMPGDFTILDLGTGGGLPGIPLKIMSPSLEFTLVDSVQKKIKAVSEMIQTLKLTHVTTIWSRAEELSKMPEFKKRFDVVICRAVAPLKELIKWSEPLLKAGSDRNGIKHEKKGK